VSHVARSLDAVAKALPGAALTHEAPAFVAPQLATLVKAPPAGERWLHELKVDGYRLICVADGERSQVYSRNKKPWARKLPSLARSLARLGHRAVLDGEGALLDERGRPSFETLVEGVHGGREGEVCLFAFDLLYLDGVDLRGAPLRERKRLLASLLEDAGEARLQYLAHVVGRGDEVLAAACRQQAEGIVSKRDDAPYHSRRAPSWQKVKCTTRQELLVVGFTPPAHKSDHLGALVLGVHDEDGRLRYAGRVGTGFSREERRVLRERLEGLEQRAPPLELERPEPGLREAHWTAPELVVEVAFSEWTRAGKVRHPAYLGIREDKDPSEVVRERPAARRAGHGGGSLP
jgi:bifunctional non-homologous end joining protein LigD